MSKSRAEFDLDRVEDKIEKIQKDLEENHRLEQKNEKDKLWELDKVRREFETRARNFQAKKEQDQKELKDYQTQRDRLKYKIEEEKEKEEEEERRLAEELYRRRMHWLILSHHVYV